LARCDPAHPGDLSQPYHLPYSLNFLRSMTAQFPSGKPIFFSPLATYSLTPDIVPWRDWEAVLNGLEWTNIGARASHYPADARATVDWAVPLRAWAASHVQPVGSRLSGEQLLELAKQIA
ncbi:MAG TPA: hypothetical protein VHO48_02570, partial [Anaerolineaceae bacterium]|nr:hypothetical protein [Anaerolineaceae bacterium]